MSDVVLNKGIVIEQLRYGHGNDVLVVDAWQLGTAEHWAIFATDSYSGSSLGGSYRGILHQIRGL